MAAAAAVRPDLADGRDLVLLVQLRWLAVAGQIAAILIATFVLGIDLPLLPMWLVLLVLVAMNLISRTPFRHWRGAVVVEMVVDMLALTTQLALSGGATNPFTILYLLQVTLSAVLLPRGTTWALVGLVAVLFLAIIPFHVPLVLPEGVELFPLYILGFAFGLLLDAVLITAFVTRITANLKERTTRLAALDQRALEEDHIVRMGLFASGAAHELGTPLASISVILGDWRHAATDPEQREDIDAMQKAIDRCKAIVTGILMTSGEARGEAPRATTVHTFIEDLANDWSDQRDFEGLSLRNDFGEDMQIVLDATLKQMMMNVLDNALEVSPTWVGLDAARRGNDLVLVVRDHGTGFAPDILADIGRAHRSTKGRQGRGLGLFLTVNAIRKLGGDVTVANVSDGAEVTLCLPLQSLALRGEDV
ncbi:ATP-binding protein [Falsirhodobacter halotolerans]|uniref:ATP-binding protein n=1 Tax=Falsirhodobacter halotolerans TaxID=1146892 RepID=UPI001FD18001|nr:ATP-binding protein [Falsirhodobacter halotolerans]MCJ8138396.1 ATP-binding protein [Falsirhodobacter halotolerans]